MNKAFQQYSQLWGAMDRYIAAPSEENQEVAEQLIKQMQELVDAAIHEEQNSPEIVEADQANDLNKKKAASDESDVESVKSKKAKTSRRRIVPIEGTDTEEQHHNVLPSEVVALERLVLDNPQDKEILHRIRRFIYELRQRLTERQRLILAAVLSQGYVDIERLQQLTNRSRRTVYEELKQIKTIARDIVESDFNGMIEHEEMKSRLLWIVSWED